MLDLRKEKVLDLTSATCLKEEATYLFEDKLTQKKLIAKFIAYYDDTNDEYLITEFKKIALLSAEPEIATVYFLASGNFGRGVKSCYVMDFVQGNTLRKVMDDNEHLSSGVISDVLSQLASGIEKAHHYEISHGDLHEGNIMINNFGYVKIIDFLWWDFRLSFEHNAQEDIKSFKSIVEQLIQKLTGSDKSLFQLQHQYLKGIGTFRNVAKNISILNRVSNELSLIDAHSKQILAKIILSIRPEANLMYVLQKKSVKIPDRHISALTDTDKKYMEREKNNKLGLKFLDTRAESIERNLNQVFNLKLHQLRQAGFIDWQLSIENVGEKFIGPYVLHFQIFFTAKLFEWKRLNHEFNFLPEPEGKSLPDLILQ